jgi:hypothetical protein
LAADQVCSVFWVDSERFARYYFGAGELILTFVGVVNTVVGGHFGSRMMFVSLYLSFCGVKKGFLLFP